MVVQIIDIPSIDNKYVLAMYVIFINFYK